MKKVAIYDTTLRDGEQAPGNSMTLEQKISLFKTIDQLGIDYIDVGFPACSPLDFAACQIFSKMKRQAKISALARSNIADIKTTIEAFCDSEHTQIQILLLGSEIHVKNKRGISIEEAIREAEVAVNYAKSQGIKDISIALEDASRGSFDYLRAIIDASIVAGATTIVLPDTVGAMVPEEIYQLVSTVKSWVGNDINVSIHCHNDMGLATANTLAAINAGVSCIQTTLCGIGERAENTALEEVLTVLKYKSVYYQTTHRIDLTKLPTACAQLIETINLSVGKHKPIIGENAFATAAGIHIHGLLRDPVVYEFVKPDDFLQTQKLYISRHVGRSAIKNKLEKLKLRYTDALIQELCLRIKNTKHSERYNQDQFFIELYQECQSNLWSKV